MMENRSKDVVVDPSKATVSKSYRQYKMDNGLFVRLQVTPSQLSVQLITKDGKIYRHGREYDKRCHFGGSQRITGKNVRDSQTVAANNWEGAERKHNHGVGRSGHKGLHAGMAN
jgi:hypothetical protein